MVSSASYIMRSWQQRVGIGCIMASAGHSWNVSALGDHLSYAKSRREWFTPSTLLIASIVS